MRQLRLRSRRNLKSSPMKAPYVLGIVAGMLLPTLAMAQVPLQPCLEIDDQTKERLDCYDAKIKPAPKKTSAPAKTVNECRFIQEQDERLNCFNKFVTVSSKKNTGQKRKP
jgi:hypothetical protein